jgi:preprotein translocase subunit SecE
MGAVEKAKETKTFLEECWVELQKVTWPDMDQLRSATVVVIVFTIVISAIIWLMDKAASWVINLIMGIFGAA